MALIPAIKKAIPAKIPTILFVVSGGKNKRIIPKIKVILEVMKE